MEPAKITKQIIEFQKTTFDNAFNAMTAFQEQTEKMVRSAMDISPLVPEEGKKTVNEWINACKKGRNDFKTMVEDNFRKAEDFFADFKYQYTKTEAV